MNYLKALVISCCIIVLNQYVNMQWWDAIILNFCLTTMVIN